MPAFVYDAAMADVASGALNLATDVLKLMLVTSSYTATKSDTVVSQASGAEIVATNYTGGFGGSGRKSAPRTITTDTTNNVVRMIFSGNAVWPALGGATNATIAAALLVKEAGAADSTSRLVAYFPLSSPLTTNGSDITLTVDATLGNITFTL